MYLYKTKCIIFFLYAIHCQMGITQKWLRVLPSILGTCLHDDLLVLYSIMYETCDVCYHLDNFKVLKMSTFASFIFWPNASKMGN